MLAGGGTGGAEVNDGGLGGETVSAGQLVISRTLDQCQAQVTCNVCTCIVQVYQTQIPAQNIDTESAIKINIVLLFYISYIRNLATSASVQYICMYVHTGGVCSIHTTHTGSLEFLGLILHSDFSLSSFVCGCNATQTMPVVGLCSRALWYCKTCTFQYIHKPTLQYH